MSAFIHSLARLACIVFLSMALVGTASSVAAAANDASRAGLKPVVTIVAAENVWADIAAQLMGDEGSVSAILASPDIDPHLFEAGPSVARALNAADIVIANGAEYDPWLASLFGAQASKARIVVNVASLVGWRRGDNVHLWFDPHAALALTDALARGVATQSPRSAQALAARKARLDATLGRLVARIAAMRTHDQGIAVAATEPVGGLLLEALGLDVREAAFQRAIQNETEPAPADIATFEDDLRQRRVVLMVYNQQLQTRITLHLCDVARAAGIPVIGFSEMLPTGMNYQGWMEDTLDRLQSVISAAPTGISR